MRVEGGGGYSICRDRGVKCAHNIGEPLSIGSVKIRHIQDSKYEIKGIYANNERIHCEMFMFSVTVVLARPSY